MILGPPSFSSNLQAPPMSGLGSPNDLGLVPQQPQQQQPPKPALSPNGDFQSAYHGTELVMLYDYKVRFFFIIKDEKCC